VHLEELEGFNDEVAKVLSLALAVVDLVTLVQVLGLEQVHDGQDLAVVGHEGLTNGVTALDEGLEDVQSGRNDVTVTSVQRRYMSHKRVSLNLAHTHFSAHKLFLFAIRKEEV
jgi:hypothetical protein